MNFGALLGGAAQGAQMGLQMKNTKQYADAYTKNADINEEKHGWEKEARAKAESGVDGIIDTANSGGLVPAPQVGPVTYSNPAAAGFGGQIPAFMLGAGGAAGPVPFQGRPGGLAQGGMIPIPDEVFAGQAPGAYQAGGLANPRPQVQPQPAPQQAAQPAQQAQPQGDEGLSRNDRLTKAIMTTDLLSNPDKLNKALAIAEASGIGDRIKPWLERAYTAKKTGLIDGGMNLMNNRVDDAIADFAKSGMKLEDRPRKANDDPNDHTWILNIAGTGEKKMNIADMVSRTVDFDKFQTHQLKQREQAEKEKTNQSDTKFKDRELTDRERRTASDIGVNNAQIAEIKDRGGRGADRPESINAAISRRDKVLDQKSSVQGDDGQYAVDPQKRLAYDQAAFEHQDLLENALGGELNAREQHKLTNALLTYPVDGTPDEKKQWQGALIRSFGGRTPEKTPVATAPLGKPAARPVTKPTPGGLTPAPLPSQDEQELHQVRFNATDQLRLRQLQKERTASNLSNNERAALEQEIRAIVDRNGRQANG